MEIFVMLFILASIIAMVVIFGVVIYKGVSEHISNNNSPVETYNAVVVAKRANVSGGGNNSSASTAYYATFELEDNSRLELKVKSSDYGTLAEGDVGVLTRQGTRFISFERKSDEFSAEDPNEQVHTCKGCGATFRGTVCEYCGTPAEVVKRSRRR